MNKTIFIIDDDPILRLIIQRMFGKIDNSLVFIPCENGKIGVEKLKEFLKSSSECVILLDLNMPVLDGWGFLDEMQASQLNTYKKIRLYILSSSTDKSDLEKSQQYAFVRKFYHKPLNTDDIIKILNGN